MVFLPPTNAQAAVVNKKFSNEIVSQEPVILSHTAPIWTPAQPRAVARSAEFDKDKDSVITAGMQVFTQMTSVEQAISHDLIIPT